MKKLTAEWVRKAENDPRAARGLLAMRPPLHDEAAFHCQQAIEKYLKALLQEHGRPILKTHDIKDLLDLLIPSDPGLRSLRRGADTLTRFAVEFWYPGPRVTARRSAWALRKALLFREAVRVRLGLST